MVTEQMRVKNTKTNMVGTTCPDMSGMLACNGPGEVSVVYDGDGYANGTQETVLEVIGPENAVPLAEKCGAGKGEECCIFLVMGAKGFECERFGSLRWDLMFRSRSMSAKREPKEPFPHCFLEN